MSEQESPFDWTIEARATWPPRARPRVPYGPTTLEVMRSCPLRACFEASRGYERRMGFAARVGTAFHRALQSLSEQPPNSNSIQEVAEEARIRFHRELQAQEALRATRPRERGLQRDDARIQRATEAVVAEAQRLWLAGVRALHGHFLQASDLHLRTDLKDVDAGAAAEPIGPEADEGTIEVEIEVRSRDGLLQGRIDCAEHTAAGTRLLDFKSALRDDLPERYERQLQLYAYLWWDTRGEWPIDAEVIYPFTATSHTVSVTPETCRKVEADARSLMESVRQSQRIEDLATPGDVCKVCQFRPWCRPFWNWQASESGHQRALERAALGLEGRIERLELIGLHWKLVVRWRDVDVRIVAPMERFPQLKRANAGTHVRVLDCRLHGQRYQPHAIITEMTEIFLVNP
jgi:PD-(D/E)XK nuclease superfamily protein